MVTQVNMYYTDRVLNVVDRSAWLQLFARLAYTIIPLLFR